MACKPCQEKALREQRARVQATIANRGSQYRSSSAVDYAKAATTGCFRMADPLTILEQDLIRVYKQRGRYGEGEGAELINDQKTIRKWRGNLAYGCPPEEEYRALRAKITELLNKFKV